VLFDSFITFIAKIENEDKETSFIRLF